MSKSNSFLLFGAIGLGAYLLLSRSSSSENGGSSSGGGFLGIGDLVSGAGEGVGGTLSGLGDIFAGLGLINKATGQSVEALATIPQAGAGLLTAGAKLITVPVKGLTNVVNTGANAMQKTGSFYAGITKTPQAVSMLVNKVTTGNYITPTATLNTARVNASLSKIGTKTSKDLVTYLKRNPGAPTSQVQAWLRS